MSMNFRASTLAFASALLFGASAHAMEGDAYIFGSSIPSSINALHLNDTQVVQVTNSGWYREDAWHIPSNENYIAGYCANCGGYLYNNFFVFDISGVTAPVTSATLTLDSFDVAAPLQYTLVDYTGNVDTLLNSSSDAGIYADLGTGVTYGGDLVSTSYTTKSFALNGAFLTNLNAAIAAGETRFVVGGTTAPVPEAGTLAYLALGLSFGAIMVRRRAA